MTGGFALVEEEVKERLERMLKTDVLNIEEEDEKLVVTVPEEDVRLAVGSGGTVVKAAELALDRSIEIKGE